MRLKDKIALITGAGTDIGEAIAHKFARGGARPLFNGLPGDPLPDVAAVITASGGEVEVHLGDVSEAPPSCLKQSSLKSHH
jgi:NAD(P)-dependent dehydrogenase (short-subunit alcohol dehydrogenase family)